MSHSVSYCDNNVDLHLHTIRLMVKPLIILLQEITYYLFDMFMLIVNNIIIVVTK